MVRYAVLPPNEVRDAAGRPAAARKAVRLGCFAHPKDKTPQLGARQLARPPRDRLPEERVQASVAGEVSPSGGRRGVHPQTRSNGGQWQPPPPPSDPRPP